MFEESDVSIKWDAEYCQSRELNQAKVIQMSTRCTSSMIGSLVAPVWRDAWISVILSLEYVGHGDKCGAWSSGPSIRVKSRTKLQNPVRNAGSVSPSSTGIGKSPIVCSVIGRSCCMQKVLRDLARSHE
jgi:hypothetical protein